MSNFQELIKSLKAFTVLIVENDFSHIEDPNEILGYCCRGLSRNNTKKIIDEVRGEYSELSTHIEEFIEKWDDLPDHNFEVLEEMGLKYVTRYLSDLGHEEIINTVLESLKYSLENENNEHLKSIFLKNGIFNDESVPKYQKILEEIKQIPECQILIYKENPTKHQWSNFIKSIEDSINETNSFFCLSIIDKNLGSGTNEGKELIKELIKAHKNSSNFKHICCLYTSSASSIILNNYDDYFIQEILKQSTNSNTDDIAKVLAKSAYAEVFNSLRIKTNKSAEITLQNVLKNQTNIKYIIDKSNEEGIPPYESIKHWHQLSIQNNFDKKEIEDFEFIASLTSFFNENYLEDHPKLSQVSEELKELNTYELFDYNVNKKYQPIYPGDIWEADGNYYILVGQLCDLLLRKTDNKRNARIGELLKIELVPPNKKKYEILVESRKKYIYINNFRDSSMTYKRLKIDISTTNIAFADLKVLDLSTFNGEGASEFQLSTELDGNIKLLLPINRSQYYDNLGNEYQLLIDSGFIYTEVLDEITSVDFPRTKFYVSTNLISRRLVVSHNLKRICRLKGRYYDSLYNNYLNNKGRIDLNLIENTLETSELKTLYYQFGNNSSSKKETEIEIFDSSEGKYILKRHLLEKLSDDFHMSVSYFVERIKISDVSVALITEQAGSIEMKFKYRVDESNLLKIENDEYKYQEIFRTNHGSFKDKEFFSELAPQTIKVFNNENKIHINELISGITITGTNEKVMIINGHLKISQIEQ